VRRAQARTGSIEPDADEALEIDPRAWRADELAPLPFREVARATHIMLRGEHAAAVGLAVAGASRRRDSERFDQAADRDDRPLAGPGTARASAARRCEACAKLCQRGSPPAWPQGWADARRSTLGRGTRTHGRAA
jgi:hypothetical protein